MREPDIVVIGSGPNGLSAAIKLATQGLRVLVLEENSRRPGGAVGSDEATLPGFVHDLGAGFFPLARLSPAFREFKLERFGLEWLNAEIESCHPALDGSSASLIRLAGSDAMGFRAEGLGDEYFGSEADTRTFQRLAAEYASNEAALVAALLGPLPGLRAFARLGLRGLLRLGLRFTQSTRRLSNRWFSSEAARRVLPGLAMHADLGPDAFAGAAMAYMLAFSATTVGYSVARGGAQRLTDSLVTALELSGGQLQLGARARRIVVRDRRAVAVQLQTGEEISFRHAVLADTSPGQLLLELLPESTVPPYAIKAARSFRQGYGTFKIDYALGYPVPWRDANARRSATVHIGESVDDLARFVRELEAG
ncbi:MAG TPA: NAD(P)/FAD-dependent oxidoreductase, partial [Polyangiaceae bacterium]|nr:NAD(P)/FAD-dependent oxidoreductase [Polyangiaceae bacterium]